MGLYHKFLLNGTPLMRRSACRHQRCRQIIPQNSFNLKYLSFGIKRRYHDNKEKYVNLSLRIDNNIILYIYSYKRENIKLYLEYFNCDEDIFIIEDYVESVFSPYKFLTIERLYGNYSLSYFWSIKDLDFENYNEEDKVDIPNILYLENSLNVYVLKCITPSAFHFEIFSSDHTPQNFNIGLSIKTFFLPKDYYYNPMSFGPLNQFYKYKVNVRILDDDEDYNRTVFCIFHNQQKDNYIKINEPNKEYNEIIYYNSEELWSYFLVGTLYNVALEYYVTSNNLINNIAEGRTVIDCYPSYNALKIKKEFSFDYISIEAKCKEPIIGYYELRLINNKDIEEESNNLIVSVPKILFPISDSININISNPYDKYDQIADINIIENYFYLLLGFYVKSNLVYINIEYISNEHIVLLSPRESEIIVPKKEYEIRLETNNYRIKDKLLFNINKCDNLVNYTLLNYYENKYNILKETQITNSYQTIILDNRYKKSKMILNKESEEEIKNDSIIYPAVYYNKGDILLNYFLIESSILKEIKFTSDFNINYEEETWSNIILYWKDYVYRESDNEKINIATNYSIYILPKNSVVNTICQLYLIPSNKSIINSTKTKIYLNEGEYKIFILADVIDENMPFKNIYNIMELKIVKVINVTLIVILSVLGLIIILLILFLVFFRKKIKSTKRRSLSKNVDEFNISNDMNNFEEEEEEIEEDSKTKKLTQELIKMKW